MILIATSCGSTPAPKRLQDQLSTLRRQSGFDEVEQGLTEENTLFEARRCLSCGNCFECDNATAFARISP